MIKLSQVTRPQIPKIKKSFPQQLNYDTFAGSSGSMGTAVGRSDSQDSKARWIAFEIGALFFKIHIRQNIFLGRFQGLMVSRQLVAIGSKEDSWPKKFQLGQFL